MKNLGNLFQQIDVKEFIGSKERMCSGLAFDSRKVQEGYLFCAIAGTVSDGHQFIDKAIENGAKVIVCEKMPSRLSAEISYVKVENTASTLGLLASAFYDHPSSSLQLVGVTGTNGKTTIASLLYQLFLNLKYKVGLISTISYKINEEELPATHTTPDQLQLNELMHKMVQEGCTHCFMEVSSHAIHQKRIAGLEFDGGIFTNISHDHLDYHKTFKEYIAAKKLFFDHLPKEAFAITNLDDKNGMVMLQNTKAKKCTYSLQALADYKNRIVEAHFDGTLMNIDGKEVWTNFVGRFNAYNLLAVYAAALELGTESEEVLIELSKLKPVSGRFEIIQSMTGVFAVVDYAHTPDALENVLGTIADIRTRSEQLICVVGAGGDRDKGKRPEMAAIACRYSDKVILTSDNPRTEDPEEILRDMQEGVDPLSSKKTLVITNRREAIKTATMLAEPGDIILIAGKGHETYQEVKGVRHHFDDKEEVEKAFGNL